MKIYLLPKSKDQYQLYSPDFQEIMEKAASPDMETEVGQPEEIPEIENDTPVNKSKAQQIMARLKSGYMSLTKKQRDLDNLLKTASESATTSLHYPSSISESQAEEIYRSLVEAQIKKHKKWMIVDGALLPFSVLLTIIPGPNLLLAYLGWRTFTHYRGQKYGKQAIAAETLHFMPEVELLKLQILVSKFLVVRKKEKINAVGNRLGITDLAKQY